MAGRQGFPSLLRRARACQLSTLPVRASPECYQSAVCIAAHQYEVTAFLQAAAFLRSAPTLLPSAFLLLGSLALAVQCSQLFPTRNQLDCTVASKVGPRFSLDL